MYRSSLGPFAPFTFAVDLMLLSTVGEVEHFPWGVVNNLMKVSPHMLQRVDIALELSGHIPGDWNIRLLLFFDEYEAYFRQVRSALPDIDKKVKLSVVSRDVCSSSWLFAGLILIINSASIFLMRSYVVQKGRNTTNIVSSRPVIVAPTTTESAATTTHTIATTTTMTLPSCRSRTMTV